ncbi:MAG: LPS export ABC transporter periplasmic protein LptC [Candidatus Acidiferrales bacterium]
MRNREAARYARWSAIAAGLIVLGVAGTYIYRAVLRARARSEMPAAVPASVERQSAQFTFSKVEQDRTLFTIRASQATQYKDHDRALLQDVWITIYGRDGNQSDNIHTRECSYDPQTGGARCEGSVQIDIGAPKKPAAGSSITPALTLVTSDLLFDRDTGNASTSAPVHFTFPGGSGSGVGVDYSTRDATVRVERAIQFQLAASEKTGGSPVIASGSSLEIHRDDRTVALNGPVTVREGQRELSAEKISIGFDAANRARQVLVQGQPQIRTNEGGSDVAVSAAQFRGLLNSAGWIESATADGNVHATRHTKAGEGSFSAQHVEFAMVPGRNLIQQMTANGGVTARSQQGAESDALRTDALRLEFVTAGSVAEERGKAAPDEIAKEQIESAETLTPATLELAKGNQTTVVSAKNLVARAAADGRIRKLFGHSGVTIRRVIAGGTPQIVSATELAATLGPRSEWETVNETGGVRIRQGDQRATAKSARIDRSTGAVSLEGSPTVTDGESRTTAKAMVFGQESGVLKATGGVVSTFEPAGKQETISLGNGAAHISAETLTGSASSGHVTYRGHVRLWQGESVLEADRIDVWRGEKKVQASGNVVAVFPQSAEPSIPDFAPAKKKSAKYSGPTLWKINAPMLTYWADQGMAHLEGGVVASSDQGTLHSRTLDVYLGPSVVKFSTKQPPGPATAMPDSGLTNFGGDRQLSRVIARGHVVVEQGDRRGLAEQAEYTASDGKFVLSGGEPTVTDGSSNTATGSSLTFYVASDTILIDSQEGSRTLTKHKVEK